jgi:hypothetical protein
MSAFADPLQGSIKQRIGNYDLEIATLPKTLTAGSQPATVMLRFAGVNGDDLIDVQITVRIEKGGSELYRTAPIVVPYGHHNFDFAFAEPGRYALYVELNDYAYSSETLTFIFPLDVAGPIDQLASAMPFAAAAAGAAVGAAVLLRIKKKRLALK